MPSIPTVNSVGLMRYYVMNLNAKQPQVIAQNCHVIGISNLTRPHVEINDALALTCNSSEVFRISPALRLEYRKWKIIPPKY
jgi:hypothetical protein